MTLFELLHALCPKLTPPLAFSSVGASKPPLSFTVFAFRTFFSIWSPDVFLVTGIKSVILLSYNNVSNT